MSKLLSTALDKWNSAKAKIAELAALSVKMEVALKNEEPSEALVRELEKRGGELEKLNSLSAEITVLLNSCRRVLRRERVGEW